MITLRQTLIQQMNTFDMLIFSPCFNSSDVEFVWALIKEILLDAIHQFVPQIKIQLNDFPK